MALLGLSCTQGLGIARSETPPSVLVVGFAGIAAISQAMNALRAPVDGVGNVRRQPVVVHVETLAKDQTPADFARKLRPQLRRYSAVYATSIALARAIQRLEPNVPIVFKGEANPVTSCLVDSMQRPGRNATGYVDYLPDDERKLLETLIYGFPRLRLVYLMVDWQNYSVPDCGPLSRSPKPPQPRCVTGVLEPGSALEWMQETAPSLEQARRLGVQLKFMVVCQPSDFAEIARLESGREDVGFIFPLQTMFWEHAEEIVNQIALAKRPAIYGRAMFAEIGGAMALEPILDADDEMAAIVTLRRVLDGQEPSNLPVQTPRGYRLVANASALAAQGLRPSLQLLRRVDDFVVTGKR